MATIGNMVFHLIVYLAAIALVVGMSFVKGKIVVFKVVHFKFTPIRITNSFAAHETIEQMVSLSLIGSYLAFAGQIYTLVTNKHALKYIWRDLLGMSGSGV